jgi:hypothetical protein
MMFLFRILLNITNEPSVFEPCDVAIERIFGSNHINLASFLFSE